MKNKQYIPEAIRKGANFNIKYAVLIITIKACYGKTINKTLPGG